MKNVLLIFSCLFFISFATAQTSTHTGKASASTIVSITVKRDTGSFYMRNTQGNASAGAESSARRSAPVTFELFPDPATDHITLTLKNPGTNQLVNLAVYDMDGKMLHKEENIAVSTSLSYNINTAAFRPGSYILKITGINGELYNSILFVKQ